MVNAESAPAVVPERKLSGPALIAAILSLALWAAFVVVMIVEARSHNEVLWTRLAFLFASVEAVAFGAAGALWGASIQRERAEKAETAAAFNQEAASNGKALATLLVTDAEVSQAAPPGAPQRLGGANPGDLDAVERHARAARALFPEL